MNDSAKIFYYYVRNNTLTVVWHTEGNFATPHHEPFSDSRNKHFVHENKNRRVISKPIIQYILVYHSYTYS